MGSNKIVLVVVVLVANATAGRAQNFDEWFKQKKTQIKYLRAADCGPGSL